MPKVSVIICTYNRAALLNRAINSVLKQSFKDFEVIIIDDASNDCSDLVIAEYTAKESRIKYYKNEFNLGIPKSRNRGVTLATGQYIAMLDSDDWWISEDKLARQVEILNANPEIGLVGTGISLFDENEKKIKDDIFLADDEDIRKIILAKNQFAQSSTLFRKDAIAAVGGYDEDLNVCEDLDLWLKIGKRYKFANIPEALTAYYVNSQGASKLYKSKIIKKTDEILEKYKLDYPGYIKAKAKSWLRRLRG